MKEENNIYKLDDKDIWTELGNHGARLTNLEAANYQAGQALLNHKAETNGNLKDFKEEVRIMVDGFKKDFKDLLGEVGHIKYFMYFSYGVTATIGVLFTIIIQWDALKHFFGGH